MAINPFFSIIIPTYNRANLIDKAINSVLNQSFQNFELIIVDDGSTDSTELIVREYHDERIQYFKKENEERGAARNFGIQRAKGIYVNFLDSDDFFDENHLQVAFEFISKSNYPNFIYQSFRIIDSSKKIKKTILFNTKKDPVAKICFQNTMAPIGAFIKLETANQNLFDHDRKFILAEDLFVWLKIISKHGVLFNNITTANLVDHEDRSMHIPNVSVISYCREKLLENLSIEKEFTLKYEFAFQLLEASHLSLEALSYALQGNKSKSMETLKLAIKINKLELFKKRSLLIIALVFLPKKLVNWRIQNLKDFLWVDVIKKIRNYFFEDYWNVALYSKFKLTDINQIPECTNKSIELKNVPKGIMLADPFFIAGYNNQFICELFNFKDQIGRIAVVYYNDKLEYLKHDILIDSTTHHSYPFILEYNKELYLIPENSIENKLDAYKLVNKQGKWELEYFKCLLLNHSVLDGTIFKWGDYYWLSSSTYNEKTGGNNNLNLFYAKTPFGDWIPHRKNPVSSDISNSRPAGKVFELNGQVYRPAQNCSVTYGGGVVVNRIKILNPDEYIEEKMIEITGASFGKDGLHTLNFDSGNLIIDIKNEKFVPFKFFYRLKRKLKMFNLNK